MDDDEARKARAGQPGGGGGFAAGGESDMVERERKHLEVMKRRQEREM